jgi:phosphoserine phosphatase
MAVKDLVLQGPRLSEQALDTFKVACTPRRIRLGPGHARCVEVADDAETRRAVQALAQYWQLDAAFVDPAMRLADFRVLAMDMDSTLVNIETLDEVAALAGKGREVAAITEAAMRGELKDYADSLRRRVALLAGADAGLLQRVLDERLRLNPGAEALVAACRRAGLTTLLVSGGFSFFTERMRERLGFDRVRANELGLDAGRLNGSVSGPAGAAIVDGQGKERALRELCAELACAPERAIAIGDGANDLPMMAAAGLSVAYRAKPVVRAQATHALDHAPLDGVLNWFVP